MTFAVISLGAAPNDNTGDPIRDGGAKVNSNFAQAQTLFDTQSATIFNNFGSLSNKINIESVWINSLGPQIVANVNTVGALQSLIATNSTIENDGFGSLSNLINIESIWSNSLGGAIFASSATIFNNFGSLSNLINIESVWINSIAATGRAREVVTYTANGTLALTDLGRIVEFNTVVGTPATYRIVNNSVVGVASGQFVDLVRVGAGSLTLVADTGVTINAASNFLSIGQQWGFGTLYKRGLNEWTFGGNLG